MQESSASKGEKTPWTRPRRWLCFWILLLVMVPLIMIYSSSPKVSWPLKFWTTHSHSSQSYSNKTTTVHSVSPDAPDGTSAYFVAYPRRYGFVLDEPHRCQQESPFLVLMIPVAPHNREARDIIRNTWGKETTVLGRVVSHYFLLGLSKEQDGTETIKEQVLQESQRHRDILQSDFLDSYNNLTIKTMVMFEWLSSHCPNTSYAMKIDSDIFLNVHNLVDMLLKAPRHLYMTGMVARGAAVLRDPNSKWFLPVSAFPDSRYPPYALGLGYVFSLDLPKKILEASAHVKAVYIEDVYVGLCMRHLGIALTDPPHGSLFRADIPYWVSNCYWTSVITTLLQNSNQLSDVWGTYQTQAQSGC
ncbi:beta-1,3-galactosyltransferase 1-like isoform X1 [Sander lucioperca]|uniref:Hexosyltransferase n=1 Tax=Sander lucioperca TaxID=283035 RepID=A0A8C9YK13_SANLU|nr:beta-1,3-galactosyltransferase 1-like isoform X1 [Sander lucioperca]